MKKIKIFICTICFVAFLYIVTCTFLITMAFPFLDSSTYKQLDTEINSLIDVLQKEEICVFGKYKTSSSKEYYGGVYSSLSFVYYDVNYEIDIVYLDSLYNIEVTFGMLEPNSLTEKETNGINKVLKIVGEYYNTDVFSPNKINENYFNDYFIENYDNEKYETTYVKTCELFQELCSYKLADGEGAYTYRAHLTEKNEFDFIEVSVCYMTKNID